MDYQDIWIDCINKLEDLAYDVDDLSDNCIPTLPLSQDNVNGPVVLHVMNDVEFMLFVHYCRLLTRRTFSVEVSLCLLNSLQMIIYHLLSREGFFVVFFLYSYLTYGDDATLNLLLAISFLIDELQVFFLVLVN